MDTLGYIYRKPSMNKLGKWNYLELSYETSEEFNEATSKLMNIFYKTDADGKCFVYDGKGQKYLLDLIHVTFNTENNTIKVLPIECNSIMPEIKTEKNDRKQIA